MPKTRPAAKMAAVAVLVAAGQTISTAAKELGLKTKTAQLWGRSPEFKALVNEHRCRRRRLRDR